jgi:acyl carrier protein
VLPIDWQQFPARFAPGRHEPLLELFAPRGAAAVTAAGGRQHRDAAPGEGQAARTRARREQLRTASVEARRHLVRDLIADEAGRVLGLLPAAVPEKRPLREVGLDSLMAVELRNGLGEASGLQLEATLLFNYPTVAELAEYVERQLETQAAAAATAASRTALDEMSEEELEDLLASKLRNL